MKAQKKGAKYYRIEIPEEGILLKVQVTNLEKKDNKPHRILPIERYVVKELDDIISEICSIFNVSFESMYGNLSDKKMSDLRKIFWYVSFEKYFRKYSWRQIGNALCRDRTTAMHSYDVVKDYIGTDDPVFMPKLETFISQSKIYKG